MKKLLKLFITVLILSVSVEVDSQVLVNDSSDLIFNGSCKFVINEMGLYGNGDMHVCSENSIYYTGSLSNTFSGTNLVFANLEINNSGGLVLMNPVKIEESVTFIDGIVSTTAGAELVISDDATVSDAGNEAHVDGPVKKEGDDDFIFPVGNGVYYRPIGMSGLTLSDTYTAVYMDNDPSDAGYDADSKELEINNVCVTEYWDISPDGAGEAYLTLYWNCAISGGINDYANLIICHWNTDLEPEAWEEIAVSSPVGSNSCGYMTTASRVSNFSPFTEGSVSSDNSLPVGLAAFDGEYINGEVFLEWETESETNNDFFEIQKSSDAVNFRRIGEVTGSGTTSQGTGYTYIDNEPGYQNYYRLKQVDYDGAYNYSDIVYIENVNIADADIFVSDGQLCVVNIAYDDAQLLVFNKMGQLILDEEISKTGEAKTFAIENADIMMVLLLSQNEIVLNKKIINN